MNKTIATAAVLCLATTAQAESPCITVNVPSTTVFRFGNNSCAGAYGLGDIGMEVIRVTYEITSLDGQTSYMYYDDVQHSAGEFSQTQLIFDQPIPLNTTQVWVTATLVFWYWDDIYEQPMIDSVYESKLCDVSP